MEVDPQELVDPSNMLVIVLARYGLKAKEHLFVTGKMTECAVMSCGLLNVEV